MAAASIYVAHFSGGVMKVGRSDNPERRVRQHEAAIAPGGVTLQGYRIFAAADSTAAERALLAACTEAASEITAREWFRGLDFEAVCQWADECARGVRTARDTAIPAPMTPGLKAALAEFQNSPSLLAAAIGGSVKRQNIEQWIRAGRVPPLQCHSVERAMRGAVTCEQLCDSTTRWARIADADWPWHPRGRPVLDVAKMAA